jgi:hypothetical protein
MSCTLNLEAPIVEEHFGHGYATKARNGFDLISHHQPTGEIRQAVLRTLKDNGNNLWKARAEISRLRVKYEEDDTLDQKQTLLYILDAVDRVYVRCMMPTTPTFDKAQILTYPFVVM